jgi:hypothetical protein
MKWPAVISTRFGQPMKIYKLRFCKRLARVSSFNKINFLIILIFFFQKKIKFYPQEKFFNINRGKSVSEPNRATNSIAVIIWDVGRLRSLFKQKIVKIRKFSITPRKSRTIVNKPQLNDFSHADSRLTFFVWFMFLI